MAAFKSFDQRHTIDIPLSLIEAEKAGRLFEEKNLRDRPSLKKYTCKSATSKTKLRRLRFGRMGVRMAILCQRRSGEI